MPYDIAVNITDSQYLGEYHKSKKHPCDIFEVIARSTEKDICMIFLGMCVNSSVESIALANKYEQYATIGIHPCSLQSITEKDIQDIKSILDAQSLEGYRDRVREDIRMLLDSKSLSTTDSIVAIGEVGLDYYREHSSRARQREVFESILKNTAGYKLPYIFHYRDCKEDFFDIVSRYHLEGVVHSYTGTLKEMTKLLDKGYYIGINGASLRENERTGVVESIPSNRLLIETDAPWCTIRRTSKYFEFVGKYLTVNKKWKKGEGVKGRNEPVNLLEVIDAVAHIRNITKEELVETTNSNFKRLFKAGQKAP